MKRIEYKKIVFTIILLVINIGVFVVVSFLGGQTGIREMLTWAALHDHAVIFHQEYYRFITSFFVHFDVEHLGHNMLMLGALGYNLELEKGHIKFILIYFLSGLGGNLVSFGIRQMMGQVVMSGGASGAVFGLMGALLGTYLKYRRPIGRMTGRGILIMVAFSIYFGFVSSGVDNAAHIGGLITGFIISLLM
ncbi:MAG: rhomboid family intramembrane serine protease [Lachnospiraceae bacterium]|nr:rhomboid family intramembrane serine protease [Lachnospiraceae bacterium]